MRKMAKQLKISEGSVRNIVRKRLNMRSYVFATGHDLSDPKKRQVRVDCCKKLLKGKNFGSILFSDEKIFTVLPPRNRKNSRIIGRSKAGKTQNFLLFLMGHFLSQTDQLTSPKTQVNHGMGRNHFKRQNRACVHPARYQSQCQVLPGRDNQKSGYSIQARNLPARRCASSFCKINDFTSQKQFFKSFMQRNLATVFARS